MFAGLMTWFRKVSKHGRMDGSGVIMVSHSSSSPSTFETLTLKKTGSHIDAFNKETDKDRAALEDLVESKRVTREELRQAG